jgi:predicted DNA-binding transcriptional regulator AlpA
MKYLTFRELRTKIGGRARSSVYLDVEAGRLPHPIKLGGWNYWVEDEVDAFLLGQRAGPLNDASGPNEERGT